MSAMMPKEDAMALKPGQRVRILVGGIRGVDGEGERSISAGESVTVISVDHYDEHDDPQGFAVTIVADNGAVNVFDEFDYGGFYPFQLI